MSPENYSIDILSELETKLQEHIADNQLILSSTLLETLSNVEIISDLLAILKVDHLNLDQATITRSDQSLQISGQTSLFDFTTLHPDLTFKEKDGKLVLTFNASLDDAETIEVPGVSWFSIERPVFTIALADPEEAVTGTVAGVIRFGSTEVPISLSLPTREGGWVLKGTVDDIRLPSLADLSALVGGNDLLGNLPPEFANASLDLSISNLELGYSPEIDQLSHISVVIRSQTNWAIIPGTLEIGGIELSLSVFFPADSELRMISGTICGTFSLGGQDLPVCIGIPSSAGSWTLWLDSIQPFQLPGLNDLVNVTGGDLATSLPPGFDIGGIDITNLAVRFDSTQKRISHAAIAFNTENTWELIPGRLEARDIAIDLTVSEPTNPSLRSVAGNLNGTITISGITIILTGELGDNFSLSGKIPRLNLTEVVEDLLNGVSLPDEVPDVEFSDIDVSYTPASGAFSVNGVGTTEWDPGIGNARISTRVSLSLTRTTVAGANGSPATSQTACSITVQGGGPIQLVDEFALRDFNLNFELVEGNSWSVSGGVGAELFGKPFDLSAGYSQSIGLKTLMLSATISSTTELVSLGDIGALDISALAIEISRQQDNQSSATKSEQEVAQRSESGSLIANSLTVNSAWNLSASGGIRVDNVFDFEGTLALFSQSDGSAGLRFNPNTASVTIPLSIPDQDVAIGLNFGDISVVRNSVGTGNQAASDTNRQSANWIFESSVQLVFNGLPSTATDILPDTVSTTFKAGNGSVSLTADRIVDGFEFHIPDIEIGSKRVALGTVLIDLSNLSILLGKNVELSVQIGLGLPEDLNNIFGVNEDGTPSLEFFRTYNPEDPANSTVKVELSVGTAGIRFNPVSSPIQAIRLVQEGGKSFWYCDLGEFGEIKLQVPQFSYNAGTGTFAASGGFETIRPLKLPLTPIKLLLEAAELQAAADVLPDGLPITDVKVVDDQGNFKVDELVSMLEAITDGQLPDEVGTILETIGSRLDRLPDSFKEYLNITVPDSFAFDIAVTPDGSVRLDARVKEGDDPIRFLHPRLEILPLAPYPRLFFYGIELRSIAFGPILGGNLFLLEVDARVDQFDMETLAASLFLPDDEDFPLPNSRAIQRRLILDKLFMVVVYQTVIPIPVPLFYDEVGIEYLGIEGVGLQTHVRFPQPKVNPAAFIQLFSSLKQFFADRNYLLDPETPPGGTNLIFSLDNNYLQLPEYLGGNVLGQKADELVIDAYANVGQLLNALKTLSLNRMIQVLPVEKRLGSANTSFGFLSFDVDWLITTPDEFRQGVYQRLSLSDAQKDEFMQILPASPGADSQSDEAKDEQGLVAFLRGNAEIQRIANFEAVFGLAASGSLGFSTGFRLTGTIANFLDMELAGRVAINASSGVQPTATEQIEVSTQNSLSHALSFDGKDDYVSIPNSDRLNFSGSIAIEAWVKPETTRGFQNIVAHGYTGSPAREVILRIGNGRYEVGSWNGANHITSFPVPKGDLGNWVHLAGVYDGSSWRLYRNGVEVSAIRSTTGAVKVNQNWAIGARGNGAERFFQGQIADIRIWNRARSPQEIQAEMNRELSGDEPGLVGYWSVSEGQGNSLRDIAGNHDGSLHGPTWIEFTKPASIASRGLIFAGEENRSKAQIPFSKALQPTAAITLEAWIKPEKLATWNSIIQYPYKADVHKNPYFEYGLYISRSRGVHTRIEGESTGIYGQGKIQIGNWHHVAITWNGASKTVAHFIDGQRVGTHRVNKGKITYNQNNSVLFGMNASGKEPFQGELKEVRIWNRARLRAEIQAAMNHRLKGDEAGLVGYWPCDDGSGPIARDLTANANHAELQSVRWAQPKAPTVPSDAAFQLVGHSHLTVLNHRVFQGDVQIVDDNFWMKGQFDLFPQNSPLQAVGSVEGEFSADRFYLAGDVQTRLADLNLAAAKAVIAHDQLRLEGSWLGASALLDVREEAGSLRLFGNIAVDIDMRVEFGAVTQTIGRNTFKMADSFRLDLAVNSALEVTVDNSGFSANVMAHFSVNGQDAAVGPFTLNVAPADIAELAEEIRRRILEEPLKYFEMLFGDATAWLEGIRSGAIDLARDAYSEIGRALRYGYGQAMSQSAELLRNVGRDVVEVGRILRSGYGQGAGVVGRALRSADYVAEDVGRMIRDVYGQGAEAATQTVRGLAYAVEDVGRMLNRTFNQGAQASATTFKKIGYAAKYTGEMLQDTFGQGTEEALGIIKNVGYSAQEAAQALNAIGANADTAARVLRDLWGDGSSEVNNALKKAGYVASQVDDAVNDAFRDAGNAINDAAQEVLRGIKKY